MEEYVLQPVNGVFYLVITLRTLFFKIIIKDYNCNSKRRKEEYKLQRKIKQLVGEQKERKEEKYQYNKEKENTHIKK